MDLPDRPRKRLDEERVRYVLCTIPRISLSRLTVLRYLSKEERKRYLVVVDEEGLLCWAKNGERITTSPDYRDSMDGIVPVSDTTTPTWRSTTGQQFPSGSPNDSDSASDISVGSNEDAVRLYSLVPASWSLTVRSRHATPIRNCTMLKVSAS